MRYALALLLFAGCGAPQAALPDAPEIAIAEGAPGPGPGEAIACFPPGFERDEDEQRVARVAELLTGRFDSSAQAAATPDYFDIHLAVCPISAPTLGKQVLYVEQARAEIAKVINAEGEYQAAHRLTEAAGIIERHPVALQLRYLQTMSEMAAESNSTTFLPIPIELFAPFLRPGGGKGGGESS